MLTKDISPVVLRVRDITKLYGISRSYVYRLTKEGKFPKPINLVEGGKCVGYLAKEVDEWFSLRVAEREVNHNAK